MWFVEYYIAGDPLPRTRLLDHTDPMKALELLHLGQDLMSLTLKYVQEKLEPR